MDIVALQTQVSELQNRILGLEHEVIQIKRIQAPSQSEALARFERLRADVRARNPDIKTDEQAEVVAEQFSQEFITSLKEQGKVQFE
jgi:hypothetical protein